MNITLIYLDTLRGKSHMPLGLGYLASHLFKAKHNVEIIACETYHYDLGHIFSKIYNSKSEVFGITAMFPEIDLACNMTKYIKAIKPKAKVILGGILPTTTPEFALEKTGADIAVLGEAEKTIVYLADLLDTGNNLDLASITGLVYKRDNEYIHTGKPEIERDLSKILTPAYEIFPMKRLTSQFFYPHTEKDRTIDILTSRGCPFSCNFCYNVSPPRYREMEGVVEEIAYLTRTYNTNAINFLDENFVLNKSRISKFVDLIKKKNIRVTYSATARASSITKEIVDLLVYSGCKTLNIAIESGDQKILDIIGKKTTVEQINSAITIAKEAGIFVEYPCMVGCLGETEKSMRSTFNLLKKLAWGDYQWRIPFFCTPYPGTEIYRIAQKKGLINGVDDFYCKFKSMNTLSINLTKMGTKDFLKLFNELKQDLIKHYFANLSRWQPANQQLIS